MFIKIKKNKKKLQSIGWLGFLPVGRVKKCPGQLVGAGNMSWL